MHDELSRRRFLQATGVLGAASLLPAWLVEAAAAATPVGPNDGILVHLVLDGGNDGLNTFVPIANGAYYD
ncbi:MAG: twin-arginine translocation signal domain-containing protein, partial [Actinomycetota bacterium]